jgi:hypothetical protein
VQVWISNESGSADNTVARQFTAVLPFHFPIPLLVDLVPPG